MKAVVLTLALTLALCGCAQVGADAAEPLPAPNAAWTVEEGITLSLLQSEYPPGVQKLTMRLENRGDNVMLYGNGWSYERWEDGEWRPLENREDAAWTSEGYTLLERSADTFEISTFALKEPLEEGLYRVTGCTLRVAPDGENLSYGGDYVEYPAYRLEFLVSEGASPEPALPGEDHEPGGLPPKEDWEWYTPWDLLRCYEDRGCTVWQFVQDDSGLMALLWREGAASEGLHEGDLLCLAIADRVTGKIMDILPQPAFEQDSVRAIAGGFAFDTEYGEVRVCRGEGGLSLSGEWQAGPYAMELESAAYPLDSESITAALINGGGEGWISLMPRLERLTEKSWEDLAANVAACGVLDPFAAGEKVWDIPLGLYGGLTAGLYRVSFEVTAGEDTVEADALFCLE